MCLAVVVLLPAISNGPAAWKRSNITASTLYIAWEVYYLNNETMSSQTWLSLRASGLTAAVMQVIHGSQLFLFLACRTFFFLLIRSYEDLACKLITTSSEYLYIERDPNPRVKRQMQHAPWMRVACADLCQK